MKVAILSLLIVTSFVTVSALTIGDFKSKYEGVQFGLTTLNEDEMLKMYQDYLVTFKNEMPGMNANVGRFDVFKASVKRVMEHNQDPTKTWKMGFNKFSDWTEEEFFEFYGLNLQADQHCSATASPRKSYNSAHPDNFDWYDQDKVTPIKNQGSCGSCWTFSTIGAMESHALLATKSTPSAAFNYSEQQLVDCAQDYDNHGCSGGLPSHAFEYISQRGGLEHRHTYEYYAKDMECHHDAEESVVTTSGSFNITEGDEEQLHEALYHEGPVSVSYQVYAGFKDYESGVYTNPDCGQTTMDVNHAVLATGFGKIETNDGDHIHFYHIKNSWGPDWGDHGTFKIRAYTNECAIGVCNSYPENVRVLTANPLNNVKAFLTSA